MNNIKRLYYGRIDVSEEIDVSGQANQKRAMFFTIGIF